MSRYYLLPIFIISLLHSSYNNSNFQSLLKDTKKQNIYKSTYWKKLLHINKNDNSSEIEKKSFFLSNQNNSAENELYATLYNFYNNKILDSNESSICKYGARYKFLDRKLNLSKYIDKPICSKRDEFMKTLNTKSISIVYSSAFINSPASQVGHTFLKIDNKLSDIDSYSINYGARPPEKENALVYMFNGLFGGYDGTFDIVKYSKKIEEYAGSEQRDLYEYKLNLTEDEIENILLHLYEIYDTPKPYKFINKNCSYQILWLIQSSKEKLLLTDKFLIEVTPIETLKLLKELKLITFNNFRPSIYDKINFIYKNKLNDFEKNILLNNNFIEKFKNNINKIKNRSYLLDSKIRLLRFTYLKNKIEKKKYIKQYMKLLRLRSQELISTSKMNIVRDKILENHKTKNIKVGYLNKNNLLLSYSSAYHNIEDFETSLDNGYINYFGFEFIINKNDTYLKRFNILDIKSYANSTILFPKISWEIKIDYGNKFIESNDKNFNVKLAIGKSYNLYNNLKFYTMLSPILSLNGDYNAIQFENGIIFINKYLKFGFQYNYRKETKYYHIVKSFLTKRLSNNSALILNYEKKDKEQLSLSYSYYF